MKFLGFDKPTQNWSKLPHQLIEALPLIETISEAKCILYVLRHTWGFSEYGSPKKFTIDEFMSGRKKHDGTRLDNGTGLSRPSVIDGCRRAVRHGFFEEYVDDSDPGRIEKFYGLMMSVNKPTQESKPFTPNSVESPTQGSKGLTPGVKGFDSRGKNFLPRTEKETKERNQKKERMDGHSKTLNEKDSLWQQALADLQLQMPRSTFDAWLLGTRAVEFDGETLRVEVRNVLAIEWLGKRLNGKIEQVVANIAGHELAVEFEARGETI